MKFKILALALVVFASAAIGNAKDAPNIAVNLEQLTSTPDVFYFSGPVNVQYRLTVSNPTSQPVTLSRLQLETIGPGAYSVHSASSSMKLRLGPNESRSMVISVWGRANGGYMNSDAPVTIHGTAYFTSPSGSFVRMFNENLMQH
jgi:hypothetical protein